MLVDREILAAVKKGSIVIDPFDREALGTNSYDVHLAPTLLTYKPEYETVKRGMPDAYYGAPPQLMKDPAPLDVRKKRDTIEHVIPDEGFVLQPDELYLAATVEYTESYAHIPILNGKSSLGRLGLSIHVTAGTGDVGFCGHWTMELFVIKPLRIYAWIPVGQLLWFPTTGGLPERSYDKKPSAKYNNRDIKPRASEFYRNFNKDKRDGRSR